MYLGVAFKVNWYNIVWDLKELSKNIIWSSDSNESIGKSLKKGSNEKERQYQHLGNVATSKKLLLLKRILKQCKPWLILKPNLALASIKMNS